MRLTVLGSNGSFPGPNGACSGYLVEEQGQYLLLDCGNGVLSRLQTIIAVEQLSAIIISHLHFDHMADLLVLRYGLETRREFGEKLSPIPLYLPASPVVTKKLVADCQDFSYHWITDATSFHVGPFEVGFYEVNHTCEAYAVRISTIDRTLTYSGDTGETPNLLMAANQADVFLCEATRPSDSEKVPLPHLSAGQAASIALASGVDRLILTHFWYRHNCLELQKEAGLIFPKVELAHDFWTFTI